METNRLLLITCFLGVLIFEMVLGAPKCSGRWAIHSCGGGNGKRSEIGFSDGNGRIDEDGLPAFGSPEAVLIDGTNPRSEEDYYGSKREEEAFAREMDNREEVNEYEERLDRALETLVRRLLKNKVGEYEG